MLVSWLQRNKMLTSAERVAVTGEIIVDGKPMYSGSVTFVPKDPINPPAFTNVGRGSGKFKIDEAHGPCPGTYSVVVYQLGTDAVKPMTGEYSIDDAVRYDLPGTIEVKPGMEPIAISVKRK